MPARGTLIPGGIQKLSDGPQATAELTSGKPHVLLIIDGFPKILGGGERIVLRLAALLPQCGFRVSILTFSYHPESEFQLDKAPCPFYLLPLTSTYNATAWRGAFALQKLIRQEQVKIVQTFFESSDLWAGPITKLLTKAKLIWSRRDMGILRSRKHGRAYRLLRKLPNLVFAVSEQVRQHAITVDGIAPTRVHTISNGVDVRVRERQRPILSEKFVRITTVGNIRRVKGHDILVRAAAEVVRYFPDVYFTIAGDVLETDYYRDLQELISTHDLNAKFAFLGRVTDLSSHLGETDIFVLPSRSEGFSNALVEAMGNALPAVATAVGGNAEAIQHGETGLIVPPEDPNALAGALIALISDREAARAIGEQGQRSVAERFTTAAMLEKTADAYRTLLSSR